MNMNCSCETIGDPFSFSLEEIEKAARENKLLSLEIEPTVKCNYACPYCYAWRGELPEKELDFDEIKTILKQAAELGAKRIVILGGEPLLYNQIFEMIDHINDLGMKASVFSNGSTLSEGKAGKLFSRNVDLVLKLNSMKPGVQEQLTGVPNALEKAFRAIANAKKAGYPSATANLAVSSVISKVNEHEMEELWTYLRDNKIQPYFETITPQGRAKGKESEWMHLSSKRLNEIFTRLAEIDKKYGFEWPIQPPLVGDKCLRHKYSCLVNSRGEVFPCVGIDTPIGSIRQSTLAEIIADSEIIQDLRKALIKGPCKTCENAKSCYGCRGATFQLTGDWRASDPQCWRNQDKLNEIAILPADAAKYIPHTGRMRFIDTLDKLGDRTVQASGVIRDDNPFIESRGRLSFCALIEYIAQTAAVENGFANGAITKGMLIGAREYKIMPGMTRPVVGDKLTVKLHKEVNFGNWGIITGKVLNSKKEILATGEIKIWQAETE